MNRINRVTVLLNRWSIVAVLLVLAPAGIPEVAIAQPRGEVRYVVVFKEEAVPVDAAWWVEAAGGSLVDSLPEVGLGIAASSDPAFADRLQLHPEVDSVGREDALEFETDSSVGVPVASAPTAADDLYPDQWNIRRARADLAWPMTSGSHRTVVAVLDTGIASNHPDLAPNLVFSTCFSTTGTCTNYPESFAGATSPVRNIHATAVASVVAAVFGGGRLVGVGPNLGLASYKTFERITPTQVGPVASNVWKSMLDAANRGFRVINVSVTVTLNRGGPSAAAQWEAWNRVTRRAQQLGSVIVSSAGNQAKSTNGTFSRLPADLPGVIGVSGTGIRPNPQYPQPGSFDVLAAYSNFGASQVLSAPSGDCGLDVGHNDSAAVFCNPATRPSDWEKFLVLVGNVSVNSACAATQSCPTGYETNRGTSFAAPVVAAVAGLVLDLNPSLTTNQVISILKRTAEPIGNQQFFGAGMVDAAAAVAEASR